MTGLVEAEADRLRGKAWRRVMASHGKEAQRSTGGDPPGIGKSVKVKSL